VRIMVFNAKTKGMTLASESSLNGARLFSK